MNRCLICAGNTTAPVCDACGRDLHFLGLDPPKSDATRDDAIAYLKTNKVTVFRCNPSEIKP